MKLFFLFLLLGCGSDNVLHEVEIPPAPPQLIEEFPEGGIHFTPEEDVQRILPETPVWKYGTDECPLTGVDYHLVTQQELDRMGYFDRVKAHEKAKKMTYRIFMAMYHLDRDAENFTACFDALKEVYLIMSRETERLQCEIHAEVYSECSYKTIMMKRSCEPMNDGRWPPQPDPDFASRCDGGYLHFVNHHYKLYYCDKDSCRRFNTRSDICFWFASPPSTLPYGIKFDSHEGKQISFLKRRECFRGETFLIKNADRLPAGLENLSLYFYRPADKFRDEKP